MKSRVVIIVEGGLVQAVYTDAPDDIALEVIDLDGDDDLSQETESVIADCEAGRLRTIY